MANGVFTYAKGRFIHWATLPEASDFIEVVLLKSAGLQADSTLQDYQTLSALLAATNDEADFTNYIRKVAAGVNIVMNTTANTATLQIANLTWLAAGGVQNNTLGKLITVYRPSDAVTDAGALPMTYHDLSAATTGSDLLVSISGQNLAQAA